MNRRKFLQMIGLAPVVAYASKAEIDPEPFVPEPELALERPYVFSRIRVLSGEKFTVTVTDPDGEEVFYTLPMDTGTWYCLPNSDKNGPIREMPNVHCRECPDRFVAAPTQVGDLIKITLVEKDLPIWFRVREDSVHFNPEDYSFDAWYFGSTNTLDTYLNT